VLLLAIAGLMSTLCIFCSAHAAPPFFSRPSFQALHGGTFTQNPLPHTFCILAKWEDTIKVAVQRKAKNKVSEERATHRRRKN